MKNILVFTTSSGKARSELLAGILAFAKGTDWNVRSFAYEGTPFPVRELRDFWTPVGCIVEGSGECPSDAFPRRAFDGLPVVHLGSAPRLTPSAVTCVMHDATSAARLATRELMSRDISRFAFVGILGQGWSERRKDAFRECVRINSGTVSCFDLPPTKPMTDTRSGLRLKRWLASLERPCGLLAADDAIAEMVLTLCRLEKIAVPDDISVVGVDDNESICEHTTPTLSSVHPDFRQGGRFAARLLARKILRSKNIPSETVFATLGLTRRGSTRTFRRSDADVSAALERIHAPGGARLSARDILAKFPCSRRNAELRFRLATGRSVLDELLDVRIALAKELLQNTVCPVGAIADQCGYRSTARFFSAFKAACGMTPLAWRKNALAPR